MSIGQQQIARYSYTSVICTCILKANIHVPKRLFAALGLCLVFSLLFFFWYVAICMKCECELYTAWISFAFTTLFSCCKYMYIHLVGSSDHNTALQGSVDLQHDRATHSIHAFYTWHASWGVVSEPFYWSMYIQWHSVSWLVVKLPILYLPILPGWNWGCVLHLLP